MKELPKRIEEISQIKEPSIFLFPFFLFSFFFFLKPMINFIILVVVVCKQGNDSQIAVDILRKALPEIQAKDLAGGLVRWSLAVDSNFPMY